jgi:hypothetical protein
MAKAYTRLLAGLALPLLLGGCGVVGAGVRLEGRATPPAVQESPQPATGQAPSIDPVHLLRADPTVSAQVKQVLRRPCRGGYADGWYPVYLRYADVTGPGQVAMIDVQTCEDQVACSGSLATYVYQLKPTGQRRVFVSTESGVRVIAAGSGLRLRRPAWGEADRSTCPNSTEATALNWNGSALVPSGKWER